MADHRRSWWVQARASAVVWRAHARRLREKAAASRHALISAVLTTAGGAGMLLGGALIGTWCLGLVLITESAGLVAAGLLRDDGKGRRPDARGIPTVHDILERARHLPPE